MKNITIHDIISSDFELFIGETEKTTKMVINMYYQDSSWLRPYVKSVLDRIHKKINSD